MKPNDLKYPLIWEERTPLLLEGVLFVPKYYHQHTEWSRAHFHLAQHAQGKPIHIEYCSGNGLWIAQKAQEHREIFWIAVEKKFERVRKIWSKMHNLQISNLLIICGEALEFSSHYLPTDSIQAVYINFPDPWPKDKHAKHRLIQTRFAHEISRCTVQGAEALIVTDHAHYTSQVIDQMQEGTPWNSAYEDPYYVTEYPNYGTSFFESLFQSKGNRIHYMKFINTKEAYEDHT